MTAITIKTIDSSTLCPGKGGTALPIVPAGTKVTVTVGKDTISFMSGYSTAHQLCTQKGGGLGLHTLLTKYGASRAAPLEVQLVIGE